MDNEKIIKIISEKLNLSPEHSEKIYNSFWKYIEELLAQNGIIEISGVGTFSLEEKENSKNEYTIKFVPDKEFVEEICYSGDKE
ncbi:MAG: hypothetical protein A2086_01920 [Spirochaetes bacterium GWD1_27_9]|nr:MAG: hypothetical protein A2Y34_10515 [Spirochaetes bacterium GWC1_27_15]OHD41618.1 MAG: hypothetical protein A2086_01920 [Spirochaetes bacterium GWD1_27_9]